MDNYISKEIMMTKWQYQKGFYYTKQVKSKERFGGMITTQFLEFSTETKRRTFAGENVMLKLDEMGLDGWELFSTTPIVGEKSIGIAGLFALDPSGAKEVTTQGVILWFKNKFE